VSWNSTAGPSRAGTPSVSDDEADVWTYFFVMTPIGLDHSGVYVDRSVRQGESWLIAQRRVKIDCQSDDSAILSRR
jgi:hypothetical protein